jgi:hypothetical protein
MEADRVLLLVFLSRCKCWEATTASRGVLEYSADGIFELEWSVDGAFDRGLFTLLGDAYNILLTLCVATSKNHAMYQLPCGYASSIFTRPPDN